MSETAGLRGALPFKLAAGQQEGAVAEILTKIHAELPIGPASGYWSTQTTQCSAGGRQMLEFELASRQSPSARELEDIHCHFESSEGYERRLLELAVDPKLESSATWLIKRRLEDRKSADRSFAIRLLDLLTLVRGWQAKLHLLQCLQHLELTGPDVPAVRVEILGLLDSSNKLVRAWAYDGLYRLAQLQHSNSAADMIRLNLALHDESPAVRARIRNLMG